MIKNHLIKYVGPAFAGLFISWILLGCEQNLPADQVTLRFWNLLANNKYDNAADYVSQDTKDFIKQSPPPAFKGSSFHTGQIIINQNDCSVETIVSPSSESQPEDRLEFLTYLTKENGKWKVDYYKTYNDLNNRNPIGNFLNDLKKMGDMFNKELERQLPRLEKDLKSFGKELENQLDKFGKELNKAFPPPKDPNLTDKAKSI